MSDVKKIVGASLTQSLYQGLVESQPAKLSKHEHYNIVVETYLSAWRQGKVPRVYLGSPQTKQRSLQLTNETWLKVMSIAEADGVSVSTVLRTAIAYFLNRRQNRNDPWGSDYAMPEKREKVLGEKKVS